MKSWLMTLPLLCMAGVAMAREAGPAETAPAQTQEQAQVQEQAKPKAKQRQGPDMRHCLDKKDNKSIIRCAEPGRKR